jgi:CheY-like chemotaxis protein
MANESTHLVLLVEDNLDHAELVMRSLAEHRLPMKVTHLRDGQAALDYLAARGVLGTVAVTADTVTVTVTTTARLQLLRVVGGDTVSFDATATAQAIKVATP